MDSKFEKQALLPVHGTPAPAAPAEPERRPERSKSIATSRAFWLVILTFYILRCLSFDHDISQYIWPKVSQAAPTPGKVHWTPCGDNQDCANVTVPLDYHAPDDRRTYSIAVRRYKATDVNHRQGAVFLNPGGPGGSGTSQVSRGAAMSTILKGQFDLIGFDPRGVNLSSPHVSCFPSLFDAELFSLTTNGFSLELPSGSNLSAFPSVQEDLERQVTLRRIQIESVAQKCRERTGEAITYMGTEFVIRDMDYLSQLIEGENKPINFWGFSYGTIVGQYLIKILPPHRIGKVVIDGVVDPDTWNVHPTYAHRIGLNDIDKVLESFAQSCFDAKENCTLNTPPKVPVLAESTKSTFKFTSPSTLLQAIDRTLDELYTTPLAVPGLPVPAFATPTTLRTYLFTHTYSINSWPELADRLSEVLYKGNWTELVAPTPNAEHKNQPDNSPFVTNVILCSDTKPYDAAHPPPSDTELASAILENFNLFGSLGDRFFALGMCHPWENAGLSPRKSRYSGGFGMRNSTLKTPMLILSNTYDPVTPLRSAVAELTRIGNNARLVQQPNGWGHCAISHSSFCTARTIRAYFVDGAVPAEAHSFCEVDQKPWQPWGESKGVEDALVLDAMRRDDDEDIVRGAVGRGEGQEEEELLRAWLEVGQEWRMDGW